MGVANRLSITGGPSETGAIASPCDCCRMFNGFPLCSLSIFPRLEKYMYMEEYIFHTWWNKEMLIVFEQTGMLIENV